MKRLLISLLMFCSGLGHEGYAQDIKLDSDLINEIIKGHKLLEKNTETLSGKIETFKNSTDVNTPTRSPIRKFLFFRDNNLLRLEYTNPMKGTEIFQGHEKNDITEVIIKSAEQFFYYHAVPSTGVPYANLSRSTVMSEASKITINADFYSKINALIALDGSLGGKVLDLLLSDVGLIERRDYKNVSDALWINGMEQTDDKGNVSNWTVVLNPNQHYALLFYEIRMVNSETEFAAISSGSRSSQITADGKILPKDILFEGQTRVMVHGEKQENNTNERSLISISSTNKPDAGLFSEESFKDLGRDYATINVLPDQTKVGGTVVLAAPPEARTPEYLLIKDSLHAWSWRRVIFVALGAVMIIAACTRMYLQRKNGND